MYKKPHYITFKRGHRDWSFDPEGTTTHFDHSVDEHRQLKASHRMLRNDQRRDRKYRDVVHDSDVHFDDLDNLGSPHHDYYDGDGGFEFDHRPFKSQTISHEYPFKPHRYGRQKHTRDLGYYDDYWLSSQDQHKSSA